MKGTLIKDGYKLEQHEVTHELMIFKDGKCIHRVKTSRPLKEREAIDVFDFIRDTDAWKEN